jgi:hypothetical protein
VAVDPFAWEDVDAGERYQLYLDLGFKDEDDPDAVVVPQDLTGEVVVFAIQPAEGAIIRLVAGTTNPAGSLVVENAVGGVLFLTLAPDTTRTLGKAAWALWTNPAAANADAVAHGTIKTRKVVPGA